MSGHQGALRRPGLSFPPTLVSRGVSPMPLWLGLHSLWGSRKTLNLALFLVLRTSGDSAAVSRPQDWGGRCADRNPRMEKALPDGRAFSPITEPFSPLELGASPASEGIALNHSGTSQSLCYRKSGDSERRAGRTSKDSALRWGFKRGIGYFAVVGGSPRFP